MNAFLLPLPRLEFFGALGVTFMTAGAALTIDRSANSR